jgi:hypothetical protein
MPTITGPLHSDGATGSIGNYATFYLRNGKRCAKRYPTRPRTQTHAQTIHRQLVAALAAAFRTLDRTAGSSWDDAAAQNKTTAFAEFLRTNTKNWYHALPIYDNEPSYATPHNGHAGIIGWSINNRQPTFLLSINALNESVPLYILYRSTTPNPRTKQTNAAKIWGCTRMKPSFTDEQLPAGRYYYEICSAPWASNQPNLLETYTLDIS